MKKQIEPHLKQAADIRLPACEFCRTVTCRNCIHFEMHSPDSEGNCRCDYFGRWYAPHHGCGNGTTWQEHYQKIHEEIEIVPKRLEERQEIQERRQNTSFRNTTGSNTSRSKTSAQNDSAAAAGGFILLALIGSLLFHSGLVKTKLSVRLLGADPAAYRVQLVNWEDADDSIDDFSNYTILQLPFEESGWAHSKLKIGKFDLWLSRDGVCGYSDYIYNNNFLDGFFGIKSEIDTGSVDCGSMLVVHLKVIGGTDGELTVTDETGEPLRCTGYGEEGEYVLLLPQGDSPARKVTVSMDGCEAQTLDLDFTNSRLLRKTVRFRSN